MVLVRAAVWEVCGRAIALPETSVWEARRRLRHGMGIRRYYAVAFVVSEASVGGGEGEGEVVHRTLLSVRNGRWGERGNGKGVKFLKRGDENASFIGMCVCSQGGKRV